MKNVLIVILLMLFFASCGDSTKQASKQDEKTVTPDESPTDAPEKAASLDELVYEGEGRSTIKAESAARSQGELKGRAALLHTLEADASGLIADFSKKYPDLVSTSATPEAWNKALRAHFNSEKFVLKGSMATEYGKSERGDTLIVTMSLPLMAGYEVIEGALVDAGLKDQFLSSSGIESFKKAFREYYVTEKKKLLTMPS